jgi:hypothetical protein
VFRQSIFVSISCYAQTLRNNFYRHIHKDYNYWSIIMQYYTDIDNVQKTLDKFGVAVIPNILNEKEIKNMQKGMWNILETLSEDFDVPIRKNDTSTWAEFYKLLPMHGMLLQYYSIGHHQSIWDVRQNPKVVEVFSELWKDDDLTTSFDGCAISLPHEITKRGYFRNNKWFHCDQSFTRNDKECYQAFVSAFDIDEGDATLSVLEGSHLHHSDCATKFKLTDKDDWHVISDEEMAFYKDKGCSELDIKCPAGSIVIWDSRTIHYGKSAIKDRKKANYRFVTYICMTPKKWCNSKNLVKKRKAFDDMRLTTHWPHRVTLFPKNPRTYGVVMPTIGKIKKPKLTKLGLSLAGF